MGEWLPAPAVAAIGETIRTPGRGAGLSIKVLLMEDPRLTARKLIEQDSRYLRELWLSYWSNGGEAQLLEFEAYVHGVYERGESDLKILAWAIHDVQPRNRPPKRRD
jgi:hypothetical protein